MAQLALKMAAAMHLVGLFHRQIMFANSIESEVCLSRALRRFM